MCCSDDDTFYPDFASLTRLLTKYDPDEEWLIGTLSEAQKQVSRSIASHLVRGLKLTDALVMRRTGCAMGSHRLRWSRNHPESPGGRDDERIWNV